MLPGRLVVAGIVRWKMPDTREKGIEKLVSSGNARCLVIGDAMSYQDKPK